MKGVQHMNERAYSHRIAHAIHQFLTGDGWRFSFDEQRGIFDFMLSLKGRLKQINYLIDVMEDKYVVYAISPLGADANDREAILNLAEFACRANFGLLNGNFELDMRDGELRYKTFVDCPDGEAPDKAIIKNSIHCPAAMYERYSAGIIDVIYGGVPAEKAIARCEGKRDQPPQREEDNPFAAMLEEIASRISLDDMENNNSQPPEHPDETADDADENE